MSGAFFSGFFLGFMVAWFAICTFAHSAESENDKKFREWAEKCHDYYKGNIHAFKR